MALNQSNILQDLSYLLGEQTIPTSSIADRQAFIQRALERIYRAYDWPWLKTNATLTVTLGVSGLITVIAQDGLLDVRQVQSGQGDDLIYKSVPYEQLDDYKAGDYRYALDGYEGNYTLYTTETSTSPVLTIRYKSTVPSLNASLPSITTPFNNSMAVARGALIYYRQAEDPQQDLSQEEAIFQFEIDEMIAAFNRNRPQPRGKTLHEVSGTYPGDISTMGSIT